MLPSFMRARPVRAEEPRSTGGGGVGHVGQPEAPHPQQRREGPDTERRVGITSIVGSHDLRVVVASDKRDITVHNAATQWVHTPPRCQRAGHG
jgi:hypothetical protein